MGKEQKSQVDSDGTHRPKGAKICQTQKQAKLGPIYIYNICLGKKKAHQYDMITMLHI